jgi:hypothetical protein
MLDVLKCRRRVILVLTTGVWKKNEDTGSGTVSLPPVSLGQTNAQHTEIVSLAELSI